MCAVTVDFNRDEAVVAINANWLGAFLINVRG
jgi:hypothetical protein